MKDIFTYLKKSIIAAIIILFVAIIFVVFNYENFKKNSTKEKVEESSYKDFTSYDKKFSIRTSSDWKEVEEKKSLNKDANLELYNESLNAYFLLVVNAKEDYKNDFNAYKKEVFKQKEEQYKMKIEEYNKKSINNHDCEYIEFNYINDKNINTYIRSYAIETDNYYGQILIWTIASNKDKVTNEFNNLLENFKEI